MPLKKPPSEAARFGVRWGEGRGRGGSRGLGGRHRDELCEFPQVLGGGGEVELLQ